MSELELTKWVILAAFSGVMWFMKKTINDLERRADEHDMEIKKIQREYLHRDDFKEFKSELKVMFEEIKSDIRALREHRV
jgi:hypothetical protein